MSSDDDIVIDGGRLTVITEGNTLVQANDTSSAAAIKCDSTLTVNGGELRLLTKGAGSKGINVNGDVYINGGDIYIVNTGDNGVSKAKGLKTDASLTVSSGHLYIYSLMANVLDAVEYNFSEGYTKYEFKPKFLEYIKLRE
ncbi:MAG: carbohydrate-binding domain-containing protein [Prevotella sp.]|nr:carbohydrate-binding domain-containing protein [Prevotella sp.]